MIAYSQCTTTPTDIALCPVSLEISQEQINSGGFDTVDSFDEEIQVPYQQKFTVSPSSVCMATISLAAIPVDTEAKKGGFSFIEWQEDIFVSMTKLVGTATFDESNSALYTLDSYHYNREAKDGDIAGRVPVSEGTQWKVLMVNFDKETA